MGLMIPGSWVRVPPAPPPGNTLVLGPAQPHRRFVGVEPPQETYRSHVPRLYAPAPQSLIERCRAMTARKRAAFIIPAAMALTVSVGVGPASAVAPGANCTAVFVTDF